MQYVFVVMAVLVLEAGVGALARLYEEQVGPELKMNLNRTFLENYSVRFRETAAIDRMQKEVSTSFSIPTSGEISLPVSQALAPSVHRPFAFKESPSCNCEQNRTRRPVVFRYCEYRCALSPYFPLSLSFLFFFSVAPPCAHAANPK